MRHSLRNTRMAKGLTQEQVALAVGISRTYYTLIELGQRTPSVDDAQRIARVLGATVDELFPLRQEREVAGS
mgnify:CR=1 FL=1